MAVSIGSLIMDLRASSKGLRKDAARAVGEGRKLGNKFAKGFAAGAVIGGALITREFAQFQKAFAEVKTITNATTQEFKALELQTIALSKKLGTDLVQSTEGLYQTLSASVPRQNAISFLETASKSAVAGVTDIRTSVDGLSTITNAWSLDTAKSMDVADAMFVAVQRGKTTFGELASSIGNVAAPAAAMNVEFTEILAATASLTKRGVQTSVATNQLRSALVALNKPTAEMEDLFTRLNVATGQQLIDQHGLVGALDELNSVATLPELIKAMGRIEGFNALVSLTGDNIGVFQGDMKAMSESTGITDKAFADMQNTLTFFWGFVKTNILGSMFPLLSAGFDTLVEKAGGINKAMAETQRAIVSLVEVGASGFGLVGDVMRGWEIIIKTGRVAFAAMFEGVLQGLGWVIVKSIEFNQALSGMINTAAIAAMEISSVFGEGFKIDLLDENAGQSIADDIKDLTAAATAARQELFNELDSALNEPLPSTAITQWLDEVKAKTKEAAFVVGTVGEEMRTNFNQPIIPETVVADTEDKAERLGASVTEGFVHPVDVGLQAVNDQIGGLVRGTISVNDALLNVAQTIVTSVIQGFVQMGTQMLTQQASMALGIQGIQTSSMAASAAAAATAGGAALASWAPAAISASIATLGGAAGAGLAAYTLSLAGGMASTVAIGALGSLAMGSLGLGTGKKRGGPVSPGMMYPVHEEGLPEFFRPDVSGEVIPLSDMKNSGMTRSDTGAGTINIQQTFTGGVTRKDLMGQAEKTKKETTSAILDAMSRGGSFRRKMHA